MSMVLDTNVIIRHLTQEPPAQGQAATHLLASSEVLVLTDVVAAEAVHMLQSVYKAPRATTASALRALMAMRSVTTERSQILRRSLDLFQGERMDFTDAYLIAFAEAHGHSQVASFDKGIDAPVTRASIASRLNPEV